MEIGEKIFYPMHGAGIVKNIEDKNIDQGIERFYVIEIPYEQHLHILINERNLDELEYRNLVDVKTLEAVYDFLSEEKFPMPKKWNERYKENLKKLKSLDLYDIAYVLKGLHLRAKKQKLSIKEIFMLNIARRILVSEFTLASGFPKNKIDKIIDFLIKN